MIGKTAFDIAKRLAPAPLWNFLASGLRDRRNRRWAGEEARRNMGLATAGTLLPNQAFAERLKASEAIEGMLSTFSMAAMDCVLALQAEQKISGRILEMGVFRGRSAALLGRWLAAGERMLLVNIADQLDPGAVAPFRGAVDYFVQSTAEFCKTAETLGTGFRFIHIDASHEYRATFSELELADRLLAPLGVVAMDDFANLNYSQNIAAIFKYLHTTGTGLRMFLVTDEKAYLCRKEAWSLYAGFVLKRLAPEMVSRGITDIHIARTDADPEHAAFYARGRERGEHGHFYGPEIYGKFFVEP